MSTLTNALLPALNSPTTTSRNSSSSWRTRLRESRLVGVVGTQAGERGLQFTQQGTLVPEHGGLIGREEL